MKAKIQQIQAKQKNVNLQQMGEKDPSLVKIDGLSVQHDAV